MIMLSAVPDEDSEMEEFCCVQLVNINPITLIRSVIKKLFLMMYVLSINRFRYHCI